MKLQVRGWQAKCSARCHQWQDDTWSEWVSVQTPAGTTPGNGYAEVSLPHCGPSADKLFIKGGGHCGSCYPAHVGVHHVHADMDMQQASKLTMQTFLTVVGMVGTRIEENNYEDDLCAPKLHILESATFLN